MIKGYFDGHSIGKEIEVDVSHLNTECVDADNPPIVLVVLCREGKVLLQDHFRYGPTFPTGKVDPDEDVRAGVCREMFEELGIDVTGITYKFTFDHIKPDGTSFKVYVVDIEFDGGIINKEPEKHTSLLWVDFDELVEVDTASLYIDIIVDNYKK